MTKDDLVSKDTALKMAIEFIDEITNAAGKYPYVDKTSLVADSYAMASKLKEALEQPSQEPVMNVTLSCGCKSSELGFPSEWAGETKECEPCTNYGMLCMQHFYKWEARPAQTHPAPSWQGLSDDERYLNEGRSPEEIEYARAIEQALKEKNT